MARTVDWDELADYYDAKQGDTGDLWHRSLIDPPLIEMVGPVRGLRLLDLGCGNGYLARRFAREGATVVGVDGSRRVIEKAQARESRDPLGVVYHVADAARLRVLGTGTFDIVYSNMALMDFVDAEASIAEVGRLLKDRGRLVASLSHPCFDTGSGSSWLLERVQLGTDVSRRIHRYREPFEDAGEWRLGDGGAVVRTRSYHRPLSWYVRVLRRAGLLLTALEEPRPTAEFMSESPQGPWLQQIPLHLVLGAQKLLLAETPSARVE